MKQKFKRKKELLDQKEEKEEIDKNYEETINSEIEKVKEEKSEENS